MSPVQPDDVVWSIPGSAARHRMSLLVLPHAGGSAHSYAQWRDVLPADVRLLVGQYPGRGARFVEDLPTSIDDLAGPILDCLPADTDDLVILGHSMGSLVAFEIAAALTARGLGPRGFIASACRAPYLPNQCPVHPELLDDDELVTAIRQRGGTEDGILDDPELREIIVPSIRADFTIDDAYRYAGPLRALTCPVAVIGGAWDPIVPVDALARWSPVTDAPTSVHVLPGDHFYFQQDLPAFMGLVTSLLDAAVSRHQLV